MTTKLTRTEFAHMVLNHKAAREYIYAGKDTYETANDLYNLAFTFPQKYTFDFGTEIHHYRDFYRLLEEFGCPPIYAEEVNYMAKQELEERLHAGNFILVDEDRILIMSSSAGCCVEKNEADEISKRTLLHCYGVKAANYRVSIGTCCQVISDTWYENHDNRYVCTRHCTHPPGLFPC